MSWTVHKFGGTSLADAECFRRVADIVLDQSPGNRAVVVSAVAGVTDVLLELIECAAGQEPVTGVIAGLRERYERLVGELLSAEEGKTFLGQFEAELEDIDSVLKALSLVKSASHRSRDMVSGFGEVWSARLLSAVLQSREDQHEAVICLNASNVLVVGAGEMGPIVSWESTQANLSDEIPDEFKGIVVITGYIARNSDGLQVTLGRNGSDYSASIFGALLKADAVHIWTDVEGVMTGDPRRVPEATVIDEISYNEAMELAYFGAKVIHPQTLSLIHI